jgi:nucleoside-diphosphate-sugar epimerase
MQIAEAVKEAGNALGLSVEIRRIPNPRVEDETHHMRIVNEKFCSLLKNRPLVDVREGIVDLMQAMSPHRQRVVALKSTFLSSDLRADVAPLSS